jgi:hypothetical protein
MGRYTLQVCSHWIFHPAQMGAAKKISRNLASVNKILGRVPLLEPCREPGSGRITILTASQCQSARIAFLTRDCLQKTHLSSSLTA